MTKQGRPRAININPTSVTDLLEAARRAERVGPTTQAELAQAAGITPGHLTDMLRRGKGARREVIDRMAAAFGVQPATIAPALMETEGTTFRFVAIRDGDPVPDEAA